MHTQSWQTDLLNLCLSTGLKPAMGRVKSVDSLRKISALSDATVGRFCVPLATQRQTADIPGAEFKAEWISRRGSDSRRVILYLPGGAYIMRTPNLHTGMVSRLCARSDARALMVYYRLAPEHPFPACLEDSILTYRWLLSEGYAPEDIVIAGDSAGGGLTLSSLLKIRDEQLPLPAAGLMLSPLLDAGDMSASRWKNARTDAMLPAAWQRAVNPRPLIIGESEPDNPYVSPIYGDYTGLPPLYVQVSDGELLLDDGLRLARRCHQYGTSARVDIWRRVPHVWPVFPFLPESTEALDKAALFVTENTPMM